MVPNEEVVQDLHFIAPYEDRATARLVFAEEGGVTRVTWTLGKPYDFGGKVAAVFMDMDEWIGPDFERGLANLQTLAETTRKEREAREAAEASQAASARLAAEGAEAGTDEAPATP